jgi:hypothetical protein
MNCTMMHGSTNIKPESAVALPSQSVAMFRMVLLLLHLSSSLTSSSALMTGLAKSSQMSIKLRHSTWSYIAGNDSLHGGRYEDLKSHSGRSRCGSYVAILNS